MGLRRSYLAVSVFTCVAFLGPVHDAGASLTEVSQIAGSGTIELFYQDQGITGANFQGTSAAIFNGGGVGPFSTLLPSIEIGSGTLIPGGMEYGVALRFGEPKEIHDLPGNGSASFLLENLLATVLDSDPYTLTFTADERLGTWSGTDWDFSPFSNPGSRLSISLSILPSRGYTFYEFFDGTAVDPNGERVRRYVGAFQFEQVAGPAVPEPAALTIWCVGSLAFAVWIRGGQHTRFVAPA